MFSDKFCERDNQTFTLFITHARAREGVMGVLIINKKVRYAYKLL